MRDKPEPTKNQLPSPWAKISSTTLKGNTLRQRRMMQNLSEEFNFDDEEDYYNTDDTPSSEGKRSESDHTPNRDEEDDTNSNSDDSRL
jgi:hypothetical protein